MENPKLHPDTLLLGLGHDVLGNQGAVKPPIFYSSTYVFQDAASMKRLFAYKNGKTPLEEGEREPMAYGRWNHPSLITLEERLCVWDGAESALAFESGMAAISACWFSFLRPGDVIVYSNPLYGGSDAFIHQQLKAMGIDSFPFDQNDTSESILNRLELAGLKERVKLIHVETPCNPHNLMIDISVAKALKTSLSNSENEVILTVDNTYFGPVFQQPIKHGADLVVYSATKYIGGHSDVVAGVAAGYDRFIKTVRSWRTQLGSTASPFTCFLLLRSLETLSLRMEKSASNAHALARFLNDHPAVKKVYYPGLENEKDLNNQIWSKQCTSSGAMIAFDLFGGEKEAFLFLDALKVIRLAVSLGGTESLCTHPATTSHMPLSQADRDKYGIGDSMIRFSVGIEKLEDLQLDLEQALSKR